MKKLNLSKKKKIVFSVVGVILAALIAVAVIAIINPKPKTSVKVTEVTKGEIVQLLEKSGTVEAEDSTYYPIIDGVKVLTVDVKLGDTVKVGDKLATFDTSSLSGMISEKTADYQNAKTLYENSVATVADAKAKIPELEKQVSKLEKEIENLKKKSETVETTTAPAKQEKDDLFGIIGNIVEDGASTIKNIINPFSAGNTNLDDITKILGSNSLVGDTELSKKQIELAEAKSKLTLMNLQVQLNIGKSYYKSLMDSKYADLQATKSAIDQLKNGWVATSNGVITEIKIKPGETYVASATSSTSNMDLTQLLTTLSGGADVSKILNSLTSGNSNSDYGMVLDSYDKFIVRFTVGETDANNVKVGQKVTIKSKTGEFSGIINYVSAKAVTSSSIDLSSISSALTGNNAASNLEVTATIENPDQSIIIGFSVDVAIELDKKENVVLVPVEAVQVETVEEKQTKYVFVYEDGKVYKREIETGILSDINYQVLAGLNKDEKVVKGVVGGAIKGLEEGQKVAIEK